MKQNNNSFILLVLYFLLLLASCNKQEKEDNNTSKDHSQIISLHNDYVDGWLQMDQNKIMELLRDDAMIQPNRLKPIQGKKAIENFWFPNDSSVTIINSFKTEILDLHILDTMAITTHKSNMDWTYKKDSIQFGRYQEGINTTIYLKENNGNWKIWRSMWTDILSQAK